MAKSKKQTMKLLPWAMAALAVVALIMLFVPAVEYAKESFNGLKVVFGYTKKTDLVVSTLETEIFKFSFLNLLTYLLVIATAVLAVLAQLKKSNLFLLISIVCAIIAGVFFLLTKNFVVLPDEAEKAFDIANTTFADEAKLKAGPIVGAVCMFLAAIAGVVKLVFGKK